MKVTTSKWWQFVIALFTVLGASFLSWYSVIGLWKVFTGLQKEVAATIIAGLVSVISVIFAKYLERKRAIEQELRQKKIPIYEDFVEFLFEMLMSEKTTGKSMSEKEMLIFLQKFTQKIIVWGSDEVLTQWSNYRMLSIQRPSSNEVDNPSVIFELEKILFAIRKDTGHKNSNLKSGDLLRLFINDVDNYKNKLS